MKVPYRCVYNHELLILSTAQTPYATYREPVSDRQTIGMVEELRGTGVDALMICPQAWMTNLWRSEIDCHWQDVAPGLKEPLFEANTKYFEKAYFRMRRYMLEGADPVGLTVQTARKCGIAPFFSYRMNECHYTNNPEGSTHSAFWRSHPEFMLEKAGSNLNYLEPEVRSYYQSVIFELLDLYDVDGFECDFMRFPNFFPAGQVEEGVSVMNEFIRSLRRKLDEVGEKRGHRLHLSVRVPRSPAIALEAGLDVAAWAREGLIDMVNASSMFRMSQETDIEGYRAILPDTSLFGELHFVSLNGEAPGGYWVNINRLASPQLYHGTALSMLDRGADGISLFNFSYTRDHSFNEPRRSYYPGVEPPFSALPALASKEQLRQGSQHLMLTSGFGTLPLNIKGCKSATVRMHAGDCFSLPFSGAVIRIEADSYISHRPFEIEINGKPARRVVMSGELFPPLSLEALPDPQKVLYFAFEPKLLKAGYNEITIHNRWLTSGGGMYRGGVRFTGIEIALYRTLSEEWKALLKP